jgi:putative transposase
MKTSRFTDSQSNAILKQAEAGSPVPKLCREHGISNATFYQWRSKFGGMDASLMARMKELEEANRCLRKMYVERRHKAEIVAEALKKKAQSALNRDELELVRRSVVKPPFPASGVVDESAPFQELVRQAAVVESATAPASA